MVFPGTLRNWCGSGEVGAGPSAPDKLSVALKDVFGHDKFRGNQRAIVQAVLDNKSVFVLMPTGGGKSLCYQLPAVLTKGVTVVVSPLLSLIEDQVIHLIQAPCGGIPATYLSSQASQGHIDAVFRELARRPEVLCKLLYVTPETLLKISRLRLALQELHRARLLARFVVDEAHCISSWGCDFRPDYRQLSQLQMDYRGVPILALTATAPPDVCQDIKSCLGIAHATVFRSSFNRANLFYRVLHAQNEREKHSLLLTLIDESGDDACGIIYCLTRDDTERVCESLQKEGKSATFFHANLGKKAKRQVQAEWQKGSVRIVCATIAMGMGIDKADVRFVIHHTLAKSLEGFYQESGRAGRDHGQAVCTVLYCPADYSRLTHMIRQPQKGVKRNIVEQNIERASQMKQFCLDSSRCRRLSLMEYLGEEPRFNPSTCAGTCDVCAGTVGTTPFVKIDDILSSRARGDDAGAGRAFRHQVAKRRRTDDAPAVTTAEHHAGGPERVVVDLL